VAELGWSSGGGWSRASSLGRRSSGTLSADAIEAAADRSLDARERRARGRGFGLLLDGANHRRASKRTVAAARLPAALLGLTER